MITVVTNDGGFDVVATSLVERLPASVRVADSFDLNRLWDRTYLSGKQKQKIPKITAKIQKYTPSLYDNCGKYIKALTELKKGRAINEVQALYSLFEIGGMCMESALAMSSNFLALAFVLARTEISCTAGKIAESKKHQKRIAETMDEVPADAHGPGDRGPAALISEIIAADGRIDQGNSSPQQRAGRVALYGSLFFQLTVEQMWGVPPAVLEARDSRPN